MSFLRSSLILALSILTISCEAQVLDPSGKTIIPQNTTVDGSSSPSNSEREATIIRNLNVKGVIPYIDMETGKVTYNKSELQGHEISIEVDFSAFQVYVKLGENYENGQQVEALATTETDFTKVLTAPNDGYKADSQGSLVIGNSFYNGGNGWTGFEMTHAVYILKTRSGKFAKVQFLKAKQGNVDLQFYFQNDGSFNLKSN